MLRSLLWMASACASLFFLVRLKNSDTVNSFVGYFNELMVDVHCGSSLMRTAVGIYRVFYNSNGNFVGGGINIYI
jgi:hypothetical protein